MGNRFTCSLLAGPFSVWHFNFNSPGAQGSSHINQSPVVRMSFMSIPVASLKRSLSLGVPSFWPSSSGGELSSLPFAWRSQLVALLDNHLFWSLLLVFCGWDSESRRPEARRS